MRSLNHSAGRALDRLGGAPRIWSVLFFLSLCSWSVAGESTTLSGVVLTPEGTPIIGARVTMGDASTRTDARGSFTLTATGSATILTIQHPHYDTFRRILTRDSELRTMDIVLQEKAVLEESMTVVAIRADEEVPITKQTLGADEIDKLSQAQDVPALLQYTPSLTWYSDSGGGTNYAYFSLRGIQMNRVNVTLDGAPLNDPAEHALYFNNFYDLTSVVDSIQIQRGVGTSTVGAPSFGGSVNFASTRFEQERTTSVRLGGGTFDTHRASLAWHSGELPGDFRIYGRASWRETDGYRDHSGSKHYTFFLNGGWQGDRTQWKWVSFSGTEESQLSYYAVDPATLAQNRRFNPMAPEERDRFGQDFAQLQMRRSVQDHTLLTASLYYNGADGYFLLWDDPVTQNDLQSYGVDQHFVGSMLTLSTSRNNLSLNAGAHINDFEGQHCLQTATGQAYTNKGLKETANAFIKATWQHGPLVWFGDLQFRWARFRYQGSLDLGSVEWRFIDPKMGLRYAINRHTSIYASVGRAQREPSRLDMLAGEDNATVNHDLEAVNAEEVWDFETGFETSGEHFTLQANLYAMEFRDEIALTGELSEIGLPLRKNVDRSDRRGLEVNARWKLSAHWNLTHASSFSHHRIREWVQFYDVYNADGEWIGSRPQAHRNVEPLLSPAFVVNQGLEWTHPLASIQATGRWVDASHLDNTGNDQLMTPSYFTLDLRTDISLVSLFSKGAPRLRVHINNVTDETEAYPSGYSYPYYQQVNGTDTLQGTAYFYPLAERHISATLNLTF